MEMQKKYLDGVRIGFICMRGFNRTNNNFLKYRSSITLVKLYYYGQKYPKLVAFNQIFTYFGLTMTNIFIILELYLNFLCIYIIVRIVYYILSA